MKYAQSVEQTGHYFDYDDKEWERSFDSITS